MVFHLDTKVYMNTKINIQSYSNFSKSEIQKYFDKAYSKFNYVVEKFSRFDDSSELSKLNKDSGNKHKVSKELYELIKFSLDLASKTNGAFDPTIIDILEAYGYDKRYDFSKLDNKEMMEKEIETIVKTRKSYKDIKLETSNKDYYITLEKGQRIDLGGCGKGYAIDLAHKELLPLENFLIEAGGDIRCGGFTYDLNSKDLSKHKWVVGLSNPDNPSENIGRMELDPGFAIACSGSFARKVKYFHHLIDPKTGKPREGIKSVFVSAPTAIVADAYATASFVVGESIREILPEEVKLKVLN
ncbi:MAG: FAD:protein FMN transferase [bacterium]